MLIKPTGTVGSANFTARNLSWLKDRIIVRSATACSFKSSKQPHSHIRFEEAIRFQLERQSEIWREPGGEFSQGGDRLSREIWAAGGGVQARQFLRRLARYRSCSVRCPVDGSVVDTYESAIGCNLQIGLEEIGSILEGPDEGGAGVLRVEVCDCHDEPSDRAFDGRDVRARSSEKSSGLRVHFPGRCHGIGPASLATPRAWKGVGEFPMQAAQRA